MMIFKNCNGNEYEVLAVCGYNKVDLNFYKYETHRLCAYALLQDFQGNCVVASGLNTEDWNSGTYFTNGSTRENLERAKEEYETKVLAYMSL